MAGTKKKLRKLTNRVDALEAAVSPVETPMEPTEAPTKEAAKAE